jgi:exonuclease III
MNVIPEVDNIQEYCEEKSMKEIADISMTPIEDRFFNQMSASDILQILRKNVQTRDTVKAIIAASKIPLEMGISQLITIELIKILRSAHEWSQTTAAKYLSESKQSDEMWHNIMISALTTAKDILQTAKSTSRAKSFRNLINRSIAASPKSSCRAIIHVFETAVAPAHVSELIEKWATKFTLIGEAPAWHKALSLLSLPDKFRLTDCGVNRVNVLLRGKIVKGNPCTQLLWNVNGLSSRWRCGDVAFGAEEQPDAPTSRKQQKKKRQYARKNQEADFRAIILRAGSPDLITIIESKISLSKMISLPGFINWCENMKYRFISLSYSSSDWKGSAGYAGVITLSKLLPNSTTFDIENFPNDEARAITHEFASFSHVSVYSPCTGYDPIKMDSRVKFDSALTSHITNQKLKFGKPVICAGDLNVNPRRQDWNEKSFEALYKQKDISGSEHHPGCSPSELKYYFNLLSVAKLTNAWEELYPYSLEGMTWHPPTDPQGTKRWGQRLDHFLISKDFISNNGEYTLISMINLRGQGSSDHNALLLNLQLTTELPSLAVLNSQENTDVVISNLDTKQSGTFKVAECPRVSVHFSYSCLKLSL